MIFLFHSPLLLSSWLVWLWLVTATETCKRCLTLSGASLCWKDLKCLVSNDHKQFYRAFWQRQSSFCKSSNIAYMSAVWSLVTATVSTSIQRLQLLFLRSLLLPIKSWQTLDCGFPIIICQKGTGILSSQCQKCTFKRKTLNIKCV